MKKIKELLNLSVIFVIVLLCFSKVATACPHPPCNPCYDWNYDTEQCEWRCSSGESCCGEDSGNCYNTTTTQCCDQETGHTCPKPVEDWQCCNIGCCDKKSCRKCKDDHHCEYCEGDFTKSCCDGECYDPQTQGCCDGKKIYNKETDKCCNEGTGHTCEKGFVDKECCDGACCDPTECESCINGDCKVCGGDVNKKCCNGSCCDKVWIKETVSSDTVSCSECDSIRVLLCSGTTTEVESYDKCVNVGVGQGEHCQCRQSYEVVGYEYYCIVNFDVSKMVSCALQGGWCTAVCFITMDTWVCSECLAGMDCCGGPCEVCDFVTGCEKNPLSKQEFKQFVFLYFSCP